ncbi:carboxylesterase/lipase family protein [Lysobacter sp. K5869]|uniref:carboxylesterase/lipase family protein n=1 Tax=Lysobacter sp. K5869 TaxID=2820808 RepID=UPI001C060937|nr:carboxylesterase/lipase family protein [Lysobacter sp. K5869]QWP75283.1 carboxylesterase/lipase family protein [Lysobacter sp. K5869]
MHEPSRRRALKALLAASAAAPLCGWGAASPVATTRSGRARGYLDSGVRVFKGLPYGADTASARFQPPRREAPWADVRDALQVGPIAPQRATAGPMSEDCLRVNVFTPGVRDGAARPVLVYVHGGGYDSGSGGEPLYDGANLCRRGDVVVVTVNHRLNAFGYLYLAPFGDPDWAWSGNVGQLDLIQALRWVREHATEFGGDPGNVTVFGQSGGGAKIATLMAMPAAQGLFHRAMTMSGQQVTAAGPRAAAQRAQRFLDALGLGPDQVQRLRSLPLERLIQAISTRDFSRIEDTALYFGPVLDARSLYRHPFHPEAPAQSAAIPMLIGNTRDETRAFLARDPENLALSWDRLPDKLRDHQYVDLPVAQVIAEYRRLYPDYSPTQVFFAATTAGRSWRAAVLEAEARARQGAPTWVYQLDWPSPLDGGRWGAMHTLDIPLVFDNTAQPAARSGDGEGARAMAATMSDTLLAFARHGDPNHPGLPAWPTYALDQRATLVFDRVSRVVLDPRGGERRLYEQAPFVQRGTF